jgi:uncharacterized protein (DUF1684 family)
MSTRRDCLFSLAGLCTHLPLVGDSQSYRVAVEAWRKQQENDFFGPDGPFTLLTRLSPKQGLSSLGEDKSCDLVIPVPRAPAHVGQLEVGTRAAVLRVLPSVHVLVDKQPVTIVAVNDGQSKEAVVDGIKLRLRFRRGALALTIIDPDSPMRAKAAPLRWFPIQEKYRVTADWVPYSQPKPMHLADSDGGGRDWECPGLAAFQLDGRRSTLEPFVNTGENNLFFTFRDSTSGNETYGAGRFFEADLPKGGKVLLDFNKAYNPMCAYNHLYSCPVPPSQNHLQVPIPAGEQKYVNTEF